MTGQISTHTWFMSRRGPEAPRALRARRMASRQLAMARSACGRAVTLPSSSRTTASWRTCESATRRWSESLPGATQW